MKSTLLLFLVIASYCREVVYKSADCEQCEVTVTLLHKAWGTNATDYCLQETAIFLCDTFEIEDNWVCDNIVGEFSDEVIYVIGQIIVEPHQICGLILKDCGNFIDPLEVTWNVTIPGNQPTPIDKKGVQPGQPTLRVLHLTDIHLDTQYQEGQEAQCGEPQCCRPPDDPTEVTALQNVTQPAGKWGTIANCDVPYSVLTNMMEFIKENHKDLDYVLVTGDLVSHAVYEYTQQTHEAMVTNISDTLRSYLPNTPIYFAVGNHEGVPIDSFAPHSVPKKYHMDWLYDTMAAAWKGWVPEDQMKVMKYMGCYMVKVFPGLRLLSINNPLGGDAVNFWLYINRTDPDGTMTWVINQLLEAEQAGDKVHIVAHIPGGDGEAMEGWAINFYKVVNRFQNTISAQFFGHTHNEGFYVVYEDPSDQTSRPTSMVYSAPSVTTYTEYFPTYRIYTIDGNHAQSTYQVIDYEEWIFNLTTANANPDKTPTWTQLSASANKDYGLNAHTPSDWNDLINRMKTDDDIFERFYINRYRRTQYDGLQPCDHKCRHSILCEARQFHHDKKLCSDLDASSAPSKPNYRKTATKRDYATWRASMKDDKCKI